MKFRWTPVLIFFGDANYRIIILRFYAQITIEHSKTNLVVPNSVSRVPCYWNTCAKRTNRALPAERSGQK
jgi:hypothetical protein